MIVETGSAADASDSGTSATVDVSGLAIEAGDVVVAFVHAHTDGNAIADDNGATPFTDALQEDGPSGTHHYAVMYRVAGASEPPSYAWALSVSDRWSAAVRVFRGVDNAAPLDVAPSGTTRGFGGEDPGLQAITAPSVALGTNGALAVALFLVDRNGGDFSNPTNGYGQALDVSGARGEDQASYTKAGLPAGATGSVSADYTFPNGWSWSALQLALKAAQMSLSKGVVYAVRATPAARAAELGYDVAAGLGESVIQRAALYAVARPLRADPAWDQGWDGGVGLGWGGGTRLAYALRPATATVPLAARYGVTTAHATQAEARYAVVRPALPPETSPAGYAVRTAAPPSAREGRYVVVGESTPGTPILDEWFDGTLAAWTTSGDASIVTVDFDEKLRLGAAGASAGRDFTAPATGPLIVESDLRYSAAGVQGYLEVLDSGGAPDVLAAVRFTGGNAYVSTDAEGETSHAFAAGTYRQFVLAFDQDAATVRFYISAADQGGRNGTWDLIAQKGYGGGTLDRVRLRATTSGTVYADMVQVFVPGAFVMGDSIADGKPNWSEQPNYATDAGGAHGRLGPDEDETNAPAYQLGLLTGEHVAARAFGAANSTQVLANVQGLFVDQHGDRLYLQIGHNDLYGNANGTAPLQANIQGIFDTVTAAGIAPDAITLCKIAPSDLFEGTPSGDEANRIEYNRWLADFCAQNGCRLAFNCEALNDNTKTSAYKRLNPAYDVGDGTHMGPAGSAVLAREMLRARVPGGVLRRAGAGLAPASYLTDAPAAATFRDLAYAVRPDTRRVLAMGYPVRATLAPVGKAAAYRVATAPAGALGLAYELAPGAGAVSRPAAYAVHRTAPGIPAAAGYGIRTPAAPVARPLGYAIDPTAHAALARGLAYRITAAPARTLGLSYGLAGEPTGAVRSMAVPPEPHGAAVPPETHTAQVTQ